MDFAYTVSGFAVGFIVGLTGVGGGSLMTPILVLLFGIKPAIAVGDRCVGSRNSFLDLSAVAGLGHAHIGTVDFVLLGSLLVGSLPGIYLGSHLGVRLPEHIIRPILASMLLIIGARFTFWF